MKKSVGLCVLGACLLSLAVGGISIAGEEITMEGKYIWVREDGEKDGSIKAVFTPEREAGTWGVKFYFDWDDGPHVYSGVARGSLTKGKLAGDITSDGDREMKFKFSGSFADGTFNGTHGFVEDDGGLADSGTITLARK